MGWVKCQKKGDEWQSPICPATGKRVDVGGDDSKGLNTYIQCRDGLLGSCAYVGGIKYSSPIKVSVPCHYPNIQDEQRWIPGMRIK